MFAAHTQNVRVLHTHTVTDTGLATFAMLVVQYNATSKPVSTHTDMSISLHALHACARPQISARAHHGMTGCIGYR